MGIALNYLTFSNYSVFQISHRCGFGSNAYFCDAFKRKYGMTPSQFRTQSRQANDPNAIATMASQNDESIKKYFNGYNNAFLLKNEVPPINRI